MLSLQLLRILPTLVSLKEQVQIHNSSKSLKIIGVDVWTFHFIWSNWIKQNPGSYLVPFFCWSRSVSQATLLHSSHQLQRHLPNASLGDPNDFLGGGASASKLMTSWSNSKKSWEKTCIFQIKKNVGKTRQNTQIGSFGIFVFLFQKHGRNSVNGWLVSQVGSWLYLPKEAMMNKSMSLWGNAMCDVGGRACICVTYVAKCGMLTPNWCSPNVWTSNRNLPRMDATPSQTIIDPPKKMTCRSFLLPPRLFQVPCQLLVVQKNQGAYAVSCQGLLKNLAPKLLKTASQGKTSWCANILATYWCCGISICSSTVFLPPDSTTSS